MKKVLLTTLGIVLVGSALLYAVGPKGPKGPKGPTCIQIEGVIEVIYTPAMQLTIDGQIVQVTNDTVITSRNIEIDSFEDLAVGMTVVVCAQEDDGELIACKINVKYKGK